MTGVQTCALPIWGGVDNDIDFRVLLGFLIGQGTVLAGAAGGQHLFDDRIS